VKNKLKAINEEFERPTQDSNKHEHESQGILKRHNGTMVQLPTFPDWFYSHPFMTNDFAHGSIKGGTPITLGSNFYFVIFVFIDNYSVIAAKVPVASQEQAILADLVNCLSGVDGQHIVAVPLEDPYAKREFRFAVGMGKNNILLLS